MIKKTLLLVLSLLFCCFKTVEAQTASTDDLRALASAKRYRLEGDQASAQVLLDSMMRALHAKGQLDSPFGLRVQLTDAMLKEEIQPDTALSKLMQIVKKSREAAVWEVYAEACLSKALIFEIYRRHESSQEWLKASLVAIRMHGLDSIYPRYAVRMSSWHRFFGQRDSTIYYAKAAIQMGKHFHQQKDLADGYLIIASILPNLSEKLMYADSALQVFRRMGNKYGVAFMLRNISDLYARQKDYQKALLYNDSSLYYMGGVVPKGILKDINLSFLYHERSIICKNIGNIDSALVYMEKAYESSVAARDDKSSSKIFRLEAELTHRRMEEQSLTLRLKNNQLAFSLIAILLVLALAAGLFAGYRKQRKSKEALAVQNALIKQQAEQLQALDAAKSRFFTNMSHEFRTPLTVILGIANELAESPAHLHNGSSQSQYIALIRRNGESLLRLINQILDLSKLDSGLLRTHWQYGDIIAYLQYLTESFYSMAQERQVRLVFYTETEALEMDYDVEKMQAIVTNLLSNALKFTPHGGKVICHAKAVLYASPNTEPSEHLQLIIQDTGKGIPEAEMPHIFERFYQVDDTTTRREEGTGIGLAFVKELVELLGGNIAVESNISKGSTFTVLLPIHRNAQVMATKPSALDQYSFIIDHPSLDDTTHEPLPYIQNSPVQKIQLPLILVIEDNNDVVIYLRTLLQNNYQIECAADGQAGIESAFKMIPDIIISDVMMPEKDGYEVCHTLKNDERTSHIPIILLTAKATQTDKVAGLRTGADAYLEKPFYKEELLVRLEKLLELRSTLQAYYAGAKSASVPTAPNGKSQHTLDDLFLEKIRQVILQKMDDSSLGIMHLCHAMRLSHTQIFRKMKALTGESPTQYIRRLRLERAKEMLRTTELNVSEIAYATGFNDPNYFSRVFQDQFGAPPHAMRK